jgi:pyruvate kinase
MDPMRSGYAIHIYICVNFLWLQYHGETIANVRTAATQCSRPVAIALDTKGPEIRTGVLAAVSLFSIEFSFDSLFVILGCEY